MRLFKQRPRILLLAAREVHPGERFEVEVVLDARATVELSFVEIALLGVEQATIGGGGRTMTQRAELVDLRRQLLGPTTLARGQRRLRASFELPADAPPTYQGVSGGMEYAFEVHVAIPWWPGVRERFELKVTLPPAQPSEPQPLLFSSAPTGPRGRELWVEGSLAASTLTPGSRLGGALALGNIEHHRLRELRLALVAEETITIPPEIAGPRSARLEARRLESQLDLPATLIDGQTLPFELELPADLPLTYAAHRWRLGWSFELTLAVRWGRDVRVAVPVSLVAAPRRSTPAAPRVVPPSVGSERLSALWSAVGAQLGLRYEQQTLRGELGDVGLELRREHRGRRGIYLVGELGYPDWGLELRVEAAGLRGRLLAGRGCSIGDERFDHLQRVRAREPAQASAVLLMLLTALDPFLPLATMDDHGLRVELRDAGQRATKLRRFAKQLTHLAREVAVARASTPPPAAMANQLTSWRALAERLGGRLAAGAMHVEGALQGQAARVMTRWSADGAPEHTLVALQSTAALPSEVCVDVKAEQGRIGQEQLAPLSRRLPEAGRSNLQRLVRGCQRLRITRQELAVELGAPLPEPLAALERLGELSRLARWLRPGVGPYR
jgi:hypothetical protein